MGTDVINECCTACAKRASVGYTYVVSLRLSIQNETEFSEWLKDFESSSLMTWRVLQNYNPSGKYVKFKKASDVIITHDQSVMLQIPNGRIPVKTPHVQQNSQ